MKTSWTLALLLCGTLHAQSTDWYRLESLAEGTELFVQSQRSLPCTLNFVDDAGIECALRGGIIRIDRSHVTAISLARPRQIIALSTLVGAAADASAVAARSDDPAKPVGAVVGAVIGGFGGYVVGYIIRLTHGPTIYVRPLSTPTSPPSPPPAAP